MRGRNLLRGLGVLFASVLIALSPSPISNAENSFICGDFDNNGSSADIADLVLLVNYMFTGGPPPVALEATDCDGDGGLDIADLICFVDYMFTGGPAPDCWVAIHEDVPGECLTGLRTVETVGDDDYMYAEADGSDIHIHHINAFYNCCIKYAVEYQKNEWQITAIEADTTSELFCDCICYFNLTSTLFGLKDGTYIVTLKGGYDFIYGGGEPITIGVDTVEISTPPVLTDYWNSPCEMLEPEKALGTIDYQLEDNTLSFDHQEAYFNCGAKFAVEFYLVGDTLRFFERNISDVVYLCMCYFDIHAQVENFKPGTYVAEVYQQSYPDKPLALYDRRTIVLEN